MRWVSILLIILAPLGVNALCSPSFFRLISAEDETDILLDAGGFIEWTNSITMGTVTVEKAQFLTDLDAWNSFVLYPITGLVSRLRIFDPQAPASMVLIPSGTFDRGTDPLEYPEASGNESPVHAVYVSEMYMDTYEVNWSLWNEVREWAVTNGYTFEHIGAGRDTNHPVHSINWYDMVKWCNARSEMAAIIPAYYTDDSHQPFAIYRTGENDIQNAWVRWDTGFRLPTEAEWEKAARGGLISTRYPWGDYTNKISHTKANYRGDSGIFYDLSDGHHPTFISLDSVYTSPVGYFEPNGYCLYDMAGNIWEWCWDWYADDTYQLAVEVDPTGPESGTSRVLRGGGWDGSAYYCRTAMRDDVIPQTFAVLIGFRAVLPVISP